MPTHRCKLSVWMQGGYLEAEKKLEKVNPQCGFPDMLRWIYTGGRTHYLVNFFFIQAWKEEGQERRRSVRREKHHSLSDLSVKNGITDILPNNV